MPPVSFIVLGAGSRGEVYADRLASHGDRARIVGIAEPRQAYRTRFAQAHQVPPDNVVADWRQLADRPKLADAAIVATPDAVHARPAVALAEKGYHILLEKPMAPNEPDCGRIVDAVRRAGVLFAVCHVMRYTPYTRAVKALVDAGRIGQVVNCQHFEPVGYWHQAHSFVRGNWRNEAESAPMLLAKSCHDVDWICHVMGGRCASVSSFGSLLHFRAENRPPTAADRCVECPLDGHCPYSARKIYLGMLEKGKTGWPVDILTPDVCPDSVLEALRTGPYGRCVYACDNDVVDHQVVNFLFEDGRTASFTMTAFCRARGRQTRLFGTTGEITGDGKTIEVFDFMTDRTVVIAPYADDPAAGGGHGGGDGALLDAFLDAVADNDPSKILSGPDETLQTHRIVFAAETARRENRTVDL